MFDKIGLGAILKRYRLVVPPNQRDYSWETQHVKTLLHDLAGAISEDEPEYFLGTIVGVEKNPNLLEIVDGQQRLATTVIFLCEIRNYLKGKEQLIADDITKSFLTDIDRAKREEVVKMQLNSADNEFFQSRIKLNGTLPKLSKPSHELIENTFKISEGHIAKIVSGLAPRDHGDLLNKWIDFIEHKANVILLTVDDSVNAYKMFETLNDRGLKTSQADLVKNYLFGQSNSRLPEAQQKWALMRGALDTAYEEDMTVVFLRHVLIAMYGHTKEKEVFDVIQKNAKGSTKALAFLDELEKLATAYVAIANPEHDKWNGYPDAVHRAIQALNNLNIKPFQPILLAIAEKFQPNEVRDSMQMLISLGVRIMIAASTRTGSVEESVSKAANSVYLGTIKNSKALRKELQGIIPNDKEFQQAFELARVSKSSLARYYLRSLEMAAKNESTPWFIPIDDKETINLEHVLPEKPESNWPDFAPETVDMYCRRIGNLALLEVKSNSNLKNSDFEMKKKVYKDSAYLLTSQLAKETGKWTEQRIVERQKILATHALKAWPI
jgi:hypothetical protein